jgi:hypothetical protein
MKTLLNKITILINALLLLNISALQAQFTPPLHFRTIAMVRAQHKAETPAATFYNLPATPTEWVFGNR